MERKLMCRCCNWYWENEAQLVDHIEYMISIGELNA